MALVASDNGQPTRGGEMTLERRSGLRSIQSRSGSGAYGRRSVRAALPLARAIWMMTFFRIVDSPTLDVEILKKRAIGAANV